MKKNELRLQMIASTYRDKLQDFGEEAFIDWVENTQFPEDKNRDRRESDKEKKTLVGAILDIIGACEEMDIEIGAVDDAEELLKEMGVK